MVLDAHTHIFPPEVRADRGKFFSVEEEFSLLYRDPRSRLVGAEDLVAYLDRNGIQAACTFGFPWRDAERARRGNDYVLDAARRFPDRILPLGCVNPLEGGGALREAERCLAAGACGLGELATYAAGLGPEVRKALGPFAELCREAGVPLLLHANEPVGHEYAGKATMGPSDLYELVRAYASTTWVLANWGGGLFVYHLLRKDADEVLRNVYYDTAAGPYLYKPAAYRAALCAAGADRLIFGSDYPLLELPRYRADMDASGLTADERAGVLGGNLARILGWQQA